MTIKDVFTGIREFVSPAKIGDDGKPPETALGRTMGFIGGCILLVAIAMMAIVAGVVDGISQAFWPKRLEDRES